MSYSCDSTKKNVLYSTQGNLVSSTLRFLCIKMLAKDKYEIILPYIFIKSIMF